MLQIQRPGTLLRDHRATSSVFVDIARRNRARIVCLAVTLLCLIGSGSGCRSLRCKKDSDETIAVTRQLSLQGKDAQQKGQWDQAEAYFAEAVQRLPTDERARYGYAESLWQRGAQEQAVVHMTEAVKLSGDDPERVVQLGQMYFTLGNLPAAARQADKAIAANKHLPNAWALKASVQRATGQNEEALATYHRALSLQPHFPAAQIAVAELYDGSGRPQRALATLQSLADQFPPGSVPPDVLFREGLVLNRLGRHQDAADCLAAAARLKPTPELLVELARARLQAGDVGSATLANNGALQMDPYHPAAIQLRSELAARQHNFAALPQPEAMR
ncbi:tetratricopeptide repeat protein [Anatilimnocola floriformis]|uniref:tetratricopeptide repeat protein n=1 Tax=Anatilimnocola floriformis TaxID=2948575 RepID=UPI0020C211DF|nr:tetratricopeptide repeat protein [Anatilimnocola floriformis]